MGRSGAFCGSQTVSVLPFENLSCWPSDRLAIQKPTNAWLFALAVFKSGIEKGRSVLTLQPKELPVQTDQRRIRAGGKRWVTGGPKGGKD